MTEKEEILKRILKTYRENEGNIITILQDLEDTFGYIPEEAVNLISKKIDIPASRFYGAATFYAQFHLKPRGKNVVTICRGTACHVKGSERLLSGLKKRFNLSDETDTTQDGKFTVERVACVGTCSMAPVVVINEKIYGKMMADRLMREIDILGKKKKGHNSGK